MAREVTERARLGTWSYNKSDSHMSPEKPWELSRTGICQRSNKLRGERQLGHPQPPCHPPATAFGPSVSRIQRLSVVLYSWIIYAFVHFVYSQLYLHTKDNAWHK